jgi:type VI secretion system protein ImpH
VSDRRALPGGGRGRLDELLFAEPYLFDFFQAVRLLERLQPESRPVGRRAPPEAEPVRFRALPSLDFPASTVHQLSRPDGQTPVPAMLVTFLGLVGPSGVLPRHYTELILRLQRDARGPERTALRAWLDLFNHRFTALFFRAWEKYRFYIAHERGEHEGREPDPFTRGLFSLIGLGVPALRDRLRVSVTPATASALWGEVVPGLRARVRVPDSAGPGGAARERVLARVDDLALLRYGGFLAHRPRCAVSLEAMLRSYLKLPVQVQQFQGQWFRLDPANQSVVGGPSPTSAMGVNVVVGERVWDVQAKIRVRLGPLSYERFLELLPDRSPVPQRKLIFLVAQLVRLYVGLEIDVDVQLVLKAAEVPATNLGRSAAGAGSRLGWNTWSRSRPMRRDADDAVFQVAEGVWLHAPAAAVRRNVHI